MANSTDTHDNDYKKSIRRKDVSKGFKRWIILGALFFVSFLENGLVRAVALILNDLTREFDVSAAYLGSILGLVFNAAYLFAFINIPLLRRFSVRQLVMFGGAISSSGLVFSSFAQTGSQFSAAFSVYGLGIIFVILPANTCPKDYFPDRLSIATSTVLSGGSAGVILMPWLFENLLRQYGWRGSLLIIAGLNAHLLVIGALLDPVRKIDSSYEGSKIKNITSSLSGDTEGDDESMIGDEYGTEITTEGTCKKLAVLSDDLSRYDETQDLDRMEDAQAEAATESGAYEPHELNRNPTEMTNDSKETDDSGFTDITCQSKALRFFGFGIFKDHPLMILVFIECFLFCHSYHAWILYVIPNALAKGLSPQRAVLVSVTGGTLNFVGRLGIGFFWSMEYIKFDLWYSLICLLSAAAFWTNFVAETFEFLMVLSACYGLLMGAKVLSQFQLVHNTVGKECYKSGVSMFFIGFGLSGPVTGAIFGRLYDLTESYDVSFGIIAAFDVAVALLNIAPFCWSRFRSLSLRDSEQIIIEEP